MKTRGGRLAYIVSVISLAFWIYCGCALVAIVLGGPR